ncbi:MAG: hypothetical protein ACKPKO_51775 [Candidatus Fonsibacter sp.]
MGGYLSDASDDDDNDDQVRDETYLFPLKIWENTIESLTVSPKFASTSSYRTNDIILYAVGVYNWCSGT